MGRVDITLQLQNVCKRRNLNLKEVNGKYLKPKASYALTKDERQMVLKWIKDLRLPDGFLNTLKRKVKNKARVEGSIVEAYLIEETSTFCSHFFAPNVETRSRTIGRNDNINQVEHVNRLSVFNSNCRPFSPKVENPANQITNNDIKRLSRGFNSIVKCWNGHIVNGYRFHTIEYGKGKSTMNSGVSISGSYYNDSTIEYYGELLEILELSFLGPGDNTVVMFKCKWFDSGRLGTKIHPRYNIVDINSARKEEVNPDELHLHERELDQEIEFDDL
ncbi:hypothetical protein BUALT_Bualt19G0022400 [Buddleja alternifolia]|uniref:DUF4218 domain-containing protein n=1 Tax=Buddleja alternifolia TaxID=168488 RepID=A0AAV6W6H5_9LAMI|nr:hypothetical protein BUALT_Bualt19G0022400 [Buddleja alternifolia]